MFWIVVSEERKVLREKKKIKFVRLNINGIDYLVRIERERF